MMMQYSVAPLSHLTHHGWTPQWEKQLLYDSFDCELVLACYVCLKLKFISLHLKLPSNEVAIGSLARDRPLLVKAVQLGL